MPPLTKSPLITSLLISVCLILMPSLTSAALFTTTTTVNAFDSNSDPSGEVSVNGLSLFDSSLGTLTGIRFNVSTNYQADIFLNSFDGSSGFAFVEALLNFQVALQIPTSSNSFILFANGGDPATISDPNETLSVGPIDLLETEEATARLQAVNLFNDFIGSGNIDFIELGIFALPSGDDVLLSDGSRVSGEPIINSFSFDPTTVSIDYTYVSAVPVPAAVWLFCSGLLGLIGFHKKAPVPGNTQFRG